MNAIPITTKSALSSGERVKPPKQEYLTTAEAAPESLMKRLEAMMAHASVMGTQQAFLRLRGQLTDAEVRACDWFHEKHAKYLLAIDTKEIRSGSAELISKAEPPDPFSEVGKEIARREREAVAEFKSAELSAKACGRDAYAMFFRTVIERQKPGGAEIAATKRVAEAVRAHKQRSSRFRRGRRG